MAGQIVNMVRVGCECGHVVSVQTAKLGPCPTLVNREDAGPVTECGSLDGVVVIVGRGPSDPLSRAVPKIPAAS